MALPREATKVMLKLGAYSAGVGRTYILRGCAMLQSGQNSAHADELTMAMLLCRCWQDLQSFQAICEVLFEEASRPLLHALRTARSKNIKFSHCALSFSTDAPLRSESCFTSNQTDSSGLPHSLKKANLWYEISLIKCSRRVSSPLEPAEVTLHLLFLDILHMCFDENHSWSHVHHVQSAQLRWHRLCTTQ